MLNDIRKKELETLLQWAACANDKYYFNMSEELFGESILGKENLFKPYIYQREIGFEEFKDEMSKKLAVISSAEELQYMIVSYNFDGAPWVIEQLTMNPACDIFSAKIAYWRCSPAYYYSNFGSPSNYPANKINASWANLLVKIEDKANSMGFIDVLPSVDDIKIEQPSGIDFSSEPYSCLPEALR